MIELAIFLSTSITFYMFGWFAGKKRSVYLNNVIRKSSESFSEGYIKGYMDASEIKRGKQYYDDFPQMGIN